MTMNRAVSISTACYSTAIEACNALAAPFLARMKAASHWNVRERGGLPSAREPIDGRSVAWIHAASLGESKVSIQFLEILKRRHPDQGYLLTATTRAGVEYLSAVKASGIVGVGFLPLDTMRLMRALLRRFAVRRVWLMETELWPSMMVTCMRLGVPVGMVNARMEEKSFASYWRFRALCSPLFGSLDRVLAQNDCYAGRFKRMGVKEGAVHIIGNLKSLVRIGSPPPRERRALRLSMNIGDGDFVLTAGCVHAGEGRILAETMSSLGKRGLRVKCIVVPRHLAETTALVNELGPGALRLTEPETTSAWSTCIVEKLGVLEDLYKSADVAFIGGTFVAVGGHNVWDAVQFCIPVFFGPDYHTQRESCEEILSAGVGFTAATAGELADKIATALADGAGSIAPALSRFVQSARQRNDRIERLIP